MSENHRVDAFSCFRSPEKGGFRRRVRKQAEAKGGYLLPQRDVDFQVIASADKILLPLASAANGIIIKEISEIAEAKRQK